MHSDALYHEVEPDELFFSTTDSRGVIDQANSVFVRMSRFSREELLGAAHNIVRHPQMPAGAFHVMWDTLQSGRPFGAYVHNLAKDGSQYDVFATITPLGDGYLSVRSRPCVTGTKSVVEGMYAETLRVEQELTEQGLGRREVAEKGAAHLAGLVMAAGFADYDDFLMAALPAEVSAREELGHGLPSWNRLDGPLRTMLDSAKTIYAGLQPHMEHLAELAQLSTELDQAANDLDSTMTDALTTADAISNVVGENPGWKPLMMPLQLWRDMGASLGEDIAALRESLRQLKSSASHTRFRIALGRLHCTMVTLFIDELITDEPGSDQALPAIQSLTTALGEGIDEMEQQSQLHTELSKNVSQQIDDVAGLMQIPVDLMAGWQQMAEAREIPTSISDLVPKVDYQIVSSKTAITNLRELAAKTAASVKAESPGELRQALSTIQELASEVACRPSE